jgi:DNA replicative helicase MCM subunit Mcm2 (Cdc46/Mcm family)
MMEAFGRYTPQIVSRLTLIFTQLKLSQDDKQDFVDEIIIKNMDDYGKVESDLKIWQQFFREYLRYVSRIPVQIYDSYGLIKSVFDTLTSKREFQEVFHARGLPDNRKWAEFANLCRSFARLNGRNQITNEDIRESYSAMLTSLQTLTTHFDMDDLALDLTPVMRNIYLEIKESGAIDVQTLGKKLRLKNRTVMSCLKELKEKGYAQQVGEVWVVSSDEAPTNNTFTVKTDKTEGWNLKELTVSGKGEISDELLEALESSEG